MSFGIVFDYIVSVIIIIIVLNIINAKEKKKYQKEITTLERDKNLIISSSILSELNKVEALVNNEKMKETFDEWQVRFKEIKEYEVPKITDALIEIEDCFNEKKYKLLNEKLAKAELEIFYVKSKANLLLDEIYENVDCKQYDEFGNLIGVEKKYINIKADLRGEVHVAKGPDYAVREDNEINGFLSGVKLTFNDCNLDYDKLFIVRNESSYSTNFEEDTAKESPTNKIVYCSDYNYYYYGSFNELLADNYQDYIINKYFSITDNNITVYDTDEFIYNNFYYFGKNSRNLLTDKFENNKTYYYTAYITVNGEDSGGNKITTVYRQKLNAIKKIKFSDNSLTSNKANILKTFKNYFSLYDENYWSVDHSISSSDLIMPCYYSSSENGALIYNERVESSLEDNLNNIEYISMNIEFGGWLNYGYFNKDSYFRN